MKPLGADIACLWTFEQMTYDLLLSTLVSVYEDIVCYKSQIRLRIKSLLCAVSCENNKIYWSASPSAPIYIWNKGS